MSEINQYIGKQIRMYRKIQNLTLQQLANLIHKSRATVSKYETGEITLDVETLYDISVALHVHMNQLTDLPSLQLEAPSEPAISGIQSPFFEARRLYFYFYEGRSRKLKDGIINIYPAKDQPGEYNASLTINAMSSTGRNSALYYIGKVTYSDMLIRFSFANQYNKLEEDLLYIFNPLEVRDFTEGLLCGISSADLKPCAFKCLVTLTPQEPTEELLQHLLFTKKELQRWKKLNMLIVDNHG